MSFLKKEPTLEVNIDSIPLKKQVNLIWLSKVINDPLQLQQKTSINLPHIEYILQHQERILQKWMSSINNNVINSHIEVIDSIDVILLEWIKCCHINKNDLSTSLINKQVKDLCTLLETPSYRIRPHIWNLIHRILEEEINALGPKKNIKSDVCTILKTRGKFLLKPEIQKKFLSSIEKNMNVQIKDNNYDRLISAETCQANNIISAKIVATGGKNEQKSYQKETFHKRRKSVNYCETKTDSELNKSNDDLVLIENPIVCVDITNVDDGDNNVKIKSEQLSSYSTQQKDTNVTSSVWTDFPSLLTLGFEHEKSDTANHNSVKVKQESVENVDTNTKYFSPIHIKREIVDENLDVELDKMDEFEEFIDIGVDELLCSKIPESRETLINDIKQEVECTENIETDNVEIFKILDTQDDGEDSDDDGSVMVDDKEFQEKVDSNSKSPQISEYLKTSNCYPSSNAEIKNENPSVEVDETKNIHQQINCDKLIRDVIGKSPNNINNDCLLNYSAGNEDDAEQEIHVVYEIEGSDEDTQNELLKIIEKYRKKQDDENSIQENVASSEDEEAMSEGISREQSEEEEDIITVLEIVSEDETDKDDVCSDSNGFVKLDELIKKSSNQTFVDGNLDYNLPTTSRKAATHICAASKTCKICKISSLAESKIKHNKNKKKTHWNSKSMSVYYDKIWNSCSIEKVYPGDKNLVSPSIRVFETPKKYQINGESYADLKTVIRNGKQTISQVQVGGHSGEFNVSPLPEVSQISPRLLMLSKPNKIPRLDINTSEEDVQNPIKSNVEAIKCLQHIKQYLLSQNDKVAVKLLIKLQMAFINCN